MTFEAIAIDGGPSEPDWPLLLTDPIEQSAARQHWLLICSVMRAAETLSAANGYMIRRLVLSQLIYDRAVVVVAREGAIRRTKGVDRRNPHWLLLKQANDLCTELEQQLGLTPRTRHRVGKVARWPRRSDADTYLRPVK